jgi:V/A-type H+-transporting ATPase subunit A
MRRLIERQYAFTDKESVREYFTRLTGLYKNLNYCEWKSEAYQRLIRQIEQLESEAVTRSMRDPMPSGIGPASH